MSTESPAVAPARASSALTAVLAAAVMVPSLLSYYPTGSDLSLHAYGITALRHYGDGLFPAGLFQLNLGQPNQLFAFMVIGLATFLPMTLALQVCAGLCNAIIVLGAARLLQHLGRTEWVLGLVVAVSFGMAFYFGMQAYLIGTGFLLGSVVELERFNESPSWTGGIKILGIIALLHFAHQMPLLFFACISLMFAVGTASSWAGFLLRAMPFALGVATTVVQLKLQSSDVAEMAVSDRGWISSPLLARMEGLPWTVFGAHESITALTLCGSWLAVFSSAAVARWRAQPPDRPTWRREDLWTFRYAILAVICVAMFLFGPNSLNTANYVADRFLPWGAMFAAIAVAPREASHLPRVLRGALALFPIALGLAIAPAVLETDAEAVALDQIKPFVRPHSAIAMLDADIRPRLEPYSSLMGDAYLAAATGGRPLHSFCYTTISPVQFSHSSLWRDSAQRMLAPWSLNFRPAIDFTAFRYALIRTDSLYKSQLIARLLEPEGRFVVHAGRWTLVESTLDVRPPTVEFGRPPFCGDRLYDRLMAVRDLISERDFLATGLASGGQCTLTGGVVGYDAVAVKSFLADEAEKTRAVSAKHSSEAGWARREPGARP